MRLAVGTIEGSETVGEQSIALDRGRHPGFPSFNVLAGSPGSLALALGCGRKGAFSMTRAFVFCSMLVYLAATGAIIAADDGPSEKVPELKALDHYAGSWDVEITSKGQPFTKGKATANWILDGRFLQQTGELQAEDGSSVVKITTLMTYDPAKKVYRSWTFLSDGNAGESNGNWDAKRRVMTSVGRKDESGGFSTTTADFSEAGIEKWRIVFKDGTGKVVGEMSGKNTRQKK
jgi:hypothetical protein